MVVFYVGNNLRLLFAEYINKEREGLLVLSLLQLWKNLLCVPFSCINR